MCGLDVFKVHESLGIPLDIILETFKRHDCVVDWLDFFYVSQDTGWSMIQAFKRIEYSLIDVYGKEYCNHVIDNLRRILSCQHQSTIMKT